MKRAFVAICAVAVWSLVLYFLWPQHTDRDKISIFKDTHSVRIHVDDKDHRYTCMSSAEYGQPYLPKQFSCYECTKSNRSKDIIEDGYSHDHIMIVVRIGDELEVRTLDVRGFDVSDFDKGNVLTSYRTPSYYPDDDARFKNVTQCVHNRHAKATCYSYKDSCLLMFGDTTKKNQYE